MTFERDTMKPETKTQFAIRNSVTLFPKSKRDSSSVKILKPASNNSKLGGGLINKGRWKGMPLYSLTLTERETCPSSCSRWSTCYGNKMPFAHRIQVDLDFYTNLEKELILLNLLHPKGFVVRLHVLGDFVDINYVLFWQRMLWQNKNLRIFGYTAHNDTVIGKGIQELLNEEDPDRCVIRFSFPYAYNGMRYASDTDLGVDSFACPEQTKKVDSCANCAACWESTKTVYFEEH